MGKKHFIGVNIIIILVLLVYLLPSVSANQNDDWLLKLQLETAIKFRDELENQKDRSAEEDQALEILRRDAVIYSNAINQNQRNREITSAEERMETAENQLKAVNWFIENEHNPEVLAELNHEKELLERTITQANEVYTKLKYPPVDWGAFGSEMLGGFISGRFYDEFQGLAKLGSLLLSEEEMERTSRNLRRLFCDYIPLPTTQCLSSKVCSKFPDHLKRDRVVVTRTASNQLQSTAHVEGTKSKPIPSVEDGEEKIETLYTATYALYNTLETPIDYRIELIGPGETHLWDNGQASPGEILSRAKTAPLIDYFTKEYNDICLVLNPGIKDYRGKRISRLCNPLVVKG